MACKMCGNKLKKNEKFCPICGCENYTYQSNSNLIFIIPAIIAYIIIASIGYKFLVGKSTSRKSQNEVRIETKNLENISFEYNAKEWKTIGSGSSKESIKFESDNSKLAITEKPNYKLNYQDLKQYVQEFGNSCTYPCKIIEEINAININGKLWYKFALTRNGYNNLYLYNTNEIKTYIIYFTTKSSDYYSELPKVEKIYNTVKYIEED